MAYDESKYIVETKHLANQVTDLKQELSELRGKNSVLRDENYEYKTVNENYKLKNSEMNFELEEITKHRGDLTLQNVEMSDDLREEVDHLTSSYDLLSDEYNNKVEVHDELLTELKNMQMAVDNLKLELGEANSDLNGSRDELLVTKQLADELQCNKDEWLSNEEKLFYQEMNDAEEKIAHLTKCYAESHESLDNQQIIYEEKLTDKSKQIQDYQIIIETQRVEHERSIELHKKEKESSLKAVCDLEMEVKEYKATIQHYGDHESIRRNDLVKENSRLQAKSIEDCDRVLITLTGLQQVIRQICTESMANRDSLKVLFAEHVKTRNMMKKLDLHHKLSIPSIPTVPFSGNIHSSSNDEGLGLGLGLGVSDRCDSKLYASNQVELGQHPVLQYGDLMSSVLEAFLSRLNRQEVGRVELNHILDGIKSKLLEEQHQYRLLSRTNDAAMIEVSVALI